MIKIEIVWFKTNSKSLSIYRRGRTLVKLISKIVLDCLHHYSNTRGLIPFWIKKRLNSNVESLRESYNLPPYGLETEKQNASSKRRSDSHRTSAKRLTMLRAAACKASALQDVTE
jgi:hypothetical protein